MSLIVPALGKCQSLMDPRPPHHTPPPVSTCDAARSPDSSPRSVRLTSAPAGAAQCPGKLAAGPPLGESLSERGRGLLGLLGVVGLEDEAIADTITTREWFVLAQDINAGAGCIGTEDPRSRSWPRSVAAYLG